MKWDFLLKAFLILTIGLTLFSLTLAPTQAQKTPEETGQAIYNTTKNAAGNAGFFTDSLPGGYGIAITMGNIISAALLIVGSVFLAFMIYGGYLWLTARGNTDQVNKAKDLIINASIGIVIVTSAYVITYFIVQAGSIGYEIGQ